VAVEALGVCRISSVVRSRNFGQVERTLLHDRDVLLGGNHLEESQSVYGRNVVVVRVRTLSICGGRLDLLSLEVLQSRN
jgi:hypothetical protein